MLVELCAGLVLVEQGELELLHLLKVVVEDELLGESGVEVVDGSFCPVILAGRQGSGGQSSTLLGLLVITLPIRRTPTLYQALGQLPGRLQRALLSAHRGHLSTERLSDLPKVEQLEGQGQDRNPGLTPAPTLITLWPWLHTQVPG